MFLLSNFFEPFGICGFFIQLISCISFCPPLFAAFLMPEGKLTALFAVHSFSTEKPIPISFFIKLYPVKVQSLRNFPCNIHFQWIPTRSCFDSCIIALGYSTFSAASYCDSCFSFRISTSQSRIFPPFSSCKRFIRDCCQSLFVIIVEYHA